MGSGQGGAAQVRRRHTGFTQLEFAVVIVALGILVFILLDRIAYYQGLAEKTTVEMTVMNMRSGLRYKVAEMLMHGKAAELPGLAGKSPVKWLAYPPPQYLGEARELSWPDMPPGSWGFDEKRGELLYRVKDERNFESARSGDLGLRLRVKLLKGLASQAGQESVVGAEIVLVENYRWF
jgi:general secretion pathway protein G